MLHVGRSKTGTTAFQGLVAANRERLAGAGLRVPAVFAGPNHGELAAAYSARPGSVGEAYGITGPHDQAALRERLLGRLQDEMADGGTWLITSEHLASRLRTRDEIAALVADLHGVAPRIHVVAHVRRPDHLLPSLWGEAVKGGGARPMDADYVALVRRHLDQRAFARRWSKHGARLVLLPYLERYRREPQAYEDGWLDVLGRVTGLDVQGCFVERAERPANTSLPLPALEYLRHLNQGGRGPAPTGPARRALIEALRDVDGPPVQLTPAASEALDAAGWRCGGLDPARRTGPLWEEWFAQADAPTAEPLELDDARIEEIAALCREHGADPRGHGWLDLVPAGVQARLRRRRLRAR